MYAYWGVENRPHLVLDVSFSNGASTAAKDNAPQNLPMLRKIALNTSAPTRPTRARTASGSSARGWSLMTGCGSACGGAGEYAEGVRTLCFLDGQCSSERCRWLAKLEQTAE